MNKQHLPAQSGEAHPIADRIIARFQPQQWINDYNVDSDPEREVDITGAALALDLAKLHQIEQHDGRQDFDVDPLTQDHAGPFVIYAQDALRQFFGVRDLRRVTQAQLDTARAAWAAAQPQPVTLYVGAFADGENASPSVAKVVLDPAFLARVERLRLLVATHRLATATIWDDPAAWGSDDGWNIQVGELRVSESGWHYTGSPKHCDYGVGTRCVSHEDTARLLAEARAAGRSYVLYECDEAELIEEGVLPAPNPTDGTG